MKITYDANKIMLNFDFKGIDFCKNLNKWPHSIRARGTLQKSKQMGYIFENYGII